MELARSTKPPRVVVWVDLAPLRDGHQVEPALAGAIGLRSRVDSDSLAAALGTTPALIVLDNCEHVLTAAADVAGRLLAGSNDTTVVATSREPLHVNGELLWRVPGLDVPTEDQAKDPARCVRSDAVRLFVERARLVQHTFAFDSTTDAGIVAICRSLDGIPLALELAAVRLRHLSLATIEELLQRPLTLLTGHEGSPDQRHRTLRATLDWSHSLLDDSERTVLRRLSVFAGSFGLDAASAVCFATRIPPAQVAQLITTLVDKSLVNTASASDRYALLESIREYSLEQLRSHEEEDLVVGRLARYLTSLADEELPLDQGPRSESSGIRLRTEFFNVAAVVPWLIRNEPRSAVALLVRYARLYWTMVPIHIGVVGDWLQRSLTTHVVRDDTRALGLLAYARIQSEILDLGRAANAAAEALAIADETQSESLKARASFVAAYVAANVGDRSLARAQLDDAMPALRRIEPDTLARALTLRAIMRSQLADHAGAEDDLREALAAWDRYIDKASSLRDLALMAGGDIAYRRDDMKLAAERIGQAIVWQRDTGHPSAGPFELIAHVMALRGRTEDALQLAGFADRLRDETGIWPTTLLALSDRSWLTELERTLGDRARLLRAKGRRMSTDQAGRRALGEERGPLTTRELAIATLVGEGLSDREIAARLAISERTAENHVQHIRQKLALRSRAQIGRWVAERAFSSTAK